MNDMAEIDLKSAAAPIFKGWRGAMLAWAALVAVILLVLRVDVEHIVGLWWNTDTFGHCLLVPFILAYLVWQRRTELSKIVPTPWLPAAGLLLIGGLGWMVGEVASVAVLRHTALVGMLIVSVPLVFGLTVARGLTFVLFFALFMIPAGEQLVPILQMVTAAICIKLLEWSGIPAFIDGVFIAIPNGNFEVAEACSGVRFLIAMIAFSVLVANLCYKRWSRRIAFVAGAIALSILANGFRAFGTIYISYLTTPAFAAGVDHIIYGWIFFAVVMLLLIAIGWRFFDRPVDDRAFDPAVLQPSVPAVRAQSAFTVAAAIGIAASLPLPVYTSLALNREPSVTTAAIEVPAVDGWQAAEPSGYAWQPNYKGATMTAAARYVDDAGQPIDLFIAVFDRQREGAELIGYQQGLLPPDSEWSWSTNAKAPRNGRAATIKLGDVTRDNWQFYLVDGKLTGSEYSAKIAGLKAQLLGGPTRAATVVISAERRDPMVSAFPEVERFALAIGPADRIVDTATIEKAE